MRSLAANLLHARGEGQWSLVAQDKDDVVPLAVTQSYLAKLGDTRQVNVVTMPGYDHDCCWDRNWRNLLGQCVQGHR